MVQQAVTGTSSEFAHYGKRSAALMTNKIQNSLIGLYSNRNSKMTITRQNIKKSKSKLRSNSKVKNCDNDGMDFLYEYGNCYHSHCKNIQEDPQHKY